MEERAATGREADAPAQEKSSHDLRGATHSALLNADLLLNALVAADAGDAEGKRLRELAKTVRDELLRVSRLLDAGPGGAEEEPSATARAPRISKGGG